MAQETDPVHWAYSSLFGTGWYQLSGERDVFVFRVPVSWQLQQAERTETGAIRPGIRFKLPMTLGLHRLEGFDDLLDPGNIGTVSITPGLELQWPVSERWRLRAHGHFGWGSDTDGEQSAWVYDLSFRSRVGFSQQDLDWGVITELFWAGYTPSQGSSSSLGGVMAGVDFSYPLNWRWPGQGATRLTWDLGYRRFSDDLSFTNQASQRVSITDEWDLGWGLGLQEGKLQFGWLRFEQLGLAYKRSSDGQFTAITLNISGAFSR